MSASCGCATRTDSATKPPPDPMPSLQNRTGHAPPSKSVGDSRGVVALGQNEYRTVEGLSNAYWFHAVFNCAGARELQTIQHLGRLGWQPMMTLEHYRLGAHSVMGVAQYE